MTLQRLKGLKELFSILLKAYGEQGWWPADTPFEVCVGAVLTQNTAWRNVERAIENLKREGLLSPEAIAEIDIGRLKELIKPSGFYNQKAERLKLLSEFIVRKGGIENLKREGRKRLRRELLSIKGIGRETADSILLYALEKPSFVVDTYTRRLLFRLGITEREDESYEEVKALFEREIPPERKNVKLYNEFHALIVKHAKVHCRKKPRCGGCPLRSFCRFKAFSSGASSQPER